MNILFVRNYPSVDGSFTLLLRLAKRFKQDGHQVFFIDFRIKTVLDTLIHETFTLITLEELISGKNLPMIDILFPFADGDLLYWSINELKNKYFKNAKFILGVYHPRAFYVSTYLGLSSDTRIYRQIFRNLPFQNIVFMNEIVKREHQKYLKLDFTNSPIIPLPITLDLEQRNCEKVDRKKIVSIGRLENSKKYVFAMLEVVVELNKENHNYDFYIYGHGQLQASIIDFIKQRNIEHYIFFMGELEYKNISLVLKDAFMFVGMGTVIIEASSMGIPSLQAIDSEKMPVSYGFFCDLKGLSIGEVNNDFPKQGMKEAIEKLSLKTKQEYLDFCLAHIKRANFFNIDEVIGLYYDFIENASADFKIRLSNQKLYLNKLIRQVYKINALVKPQHRSM